MSDILVVEDELDILDILTEQLKMKGHKVEAASDGFEGFEKARDKKFDLIITDYSMPKLNGAQLISKLRDNKFNKNTPIIVYTAFPEPARTEASHFGDVHFIEKPSTDNELEDLIEEFSL
jgi:CheY-like chemotaxis protein